MVFLPHLRKAEDGIAAKVKRLAEAGLTYPKLDCDKAIAWCEKRTGKTLAPSQREALKTVLTSRVAIITGGPGVGKTTLVNSILLILRAKKVKCLLCAPTGRAANCGQRLQRLTADEMALLVGANADDRVAMAWLATLKHTQFAFDFASEVMREKITIHDLVLRPSDYESFVEGKSLIHRSLGQLKPSSKSKIRQVCEPPGRLPSPRRIGRAEVETTAHPRPTEARADRRITVV